jgi:CubicO group peptidase (beta-lactamase class C family)
MKDPFDANPITAPFDSQPSIAETIQPFVDRGLIAGAVTLAATKDTLLALEAFGYADLATKKPMATDALFWIASMTKPMTCTGLMMLVDEGKVNVEDPVENYLPEFKGQMMIAEKDEEHVVLRQPAHPIKVSEVLNHTSGLAFSCAIETPTFDHLRLRDSVRAHAMLPLQFEPGTKYQYSNAGHNTVGRIIEVVSGMPYEVFMDRRLFGPLGLDQTTFWPSEEQLKRFAKIYRSREDKSGLEEATLMQLKYPFSDPHRTPMPAGGLFSTAEDCATFCRMILNDGEYKGRRYLSAATIEEMTRRHTPENLETSYGFGWDTAGGKFRHGGAYKTDMTIDPKRGLVTVLLLHHTNDWHHEDGQNLRARFVAAAENLQQGTIVS